MTILDWISANAKIRNSIKWEREPGEILDFAAWTEDMKNKLLQVYNQAKNQNWLFVPDPPANLKILDEDDFNETYISVHDAWEIYIAYIAHSLAVEIKKWVSWSILNYEQEDLWELLDSRAFFRSHQDNELGRVYVIGYWTSANATLGTPSLAWALLKYTTGIVNTPKETVANLLQWCRENMVHFGGAPSGREYPTAAHDAHWHYRGYVPTSRVILGTYKQYDNDELKIHINETERKHYTGGCHGTNGFLRNVLRTVNIPVLYERYAKHALPYFPTIEKHLSHGDDPYNQNVKASGYPASYLLMDDADYDSVYTDQDADEDQHNSLLVGFHVRQLTIKWLPLNLLHKRIADGYESDNRSRVLGMFKDSYGKWIMTEEELEEAKLWERMDGKIKAYGGPEKVPAVGEEDYLWDSWQSVLSKMKIAEQHQIRRKAREDYLRVQRKQPDFSTLKKTQPALSSAITQMEQSIQSSGRRDPGRKRSRPPIKEPVLPKDRPRRKPRRMKTPISEKPKKPAKKPPAKKEAPPADKKESPSDKEEKASVRKRITKQLKKVVRRG